MEKITYDELKDIFGEHNRKADSYDNPLYAVIVIGDFGNGESYSLESRSYITMSNSWGWDWSKAGRSKTGICMDKSETIRLDWYLDDGSWKVDYCYLISKDEFEAFTK